MKKNRTLRADALALCCALAVAGGAAAFAHGNAGATLKALTARPEVKVALNGTVARDGNVIALDKAGAVHPGEVLDWTITSENDGDGAAREYKTVGQIPQGTLLVAGSTVADGAVSVTYSIDGGQTFSAQPVIEEKGADGTVKKVAAPVSIYTQVRYEWSDALAAGGKLNASYKVRVK
ncbi:MAG: hypothetical protein M3407_00555 [Acidobacteriota bacterium]|nr:hypothetical protein [Acidobacteriota bacterium]